MKNECIQLLLVIMSCCSSSYAAEKLVIIGSGAAGLTAAIYAGQARLAPLVVEGEECEGQLASVFYMENFPGFPEGIAGDELIRRLRAQSEKFGARFQPGSVVDVDLQQRPFRITLSDEHAVYADALIIASGTSKRWLGLQSEEALKGKGVSSSVICETATYQGKDVVVIGGGDAAVEEALALSAYAANVSIVHRNSTLNASGYLQDKIASYGNIQVILDATVLEILDVSKDTVTGVVLRDIKTGKKKTISCEAVFISIGRQTNTSLFQGQLQCTPSGLIVVHPGSAKTSVPGVFAAGDVSDATYRKAVTAAGAGCMAALDAIHFLLH